MIASRRAGLAALVFLGIAARQAAEMARRKREEGGAEPKAETPKP